MCFFVALYSLIFYLVTDVNSTGDIFTMHWKVLHNQCWISIKFANIKSKLDEHIRVEALIELQNIFCAQNKITGNDSDIVSENI